MDHRGSGDLRKQSSSQVLSPHRERPKATLGRDHQVGKACASDCRHSTGCRSGGTIMSVRRRMEDDIDRDIRDHIDMETRENIERGMTPPEARAAALRKFGNPLRIAEDTRAVWRSGWFERLL